MNLKRLIAAAALLCAGALPAQTIVVSASHLTDSSGNAVSNGTISFAPVDAAGDPLSYRRSGSGQTTKLPVSALVTNGAFSLTLPDVALTSPANVCFAVTAVDNVSGNQLLAPEYNCVQPSSAAYASSWCSTTGGVTTCNFDNYTPAFASIGPVATGPQGPAGPTGPTGPAGPSGSGYIALSTFAGSDLGAKISAADAAYSGKPAVFEVDQAGTLSTSPTLSVGHSIEVGAAVAWNATINVTTDNAIRCMGPGAILTVTMSAGTGLLTAQSSGSARVTFEDCHVESNNNPLFSTANQSTDVAIIDNYVHNGQLYFQNSAGSGSPTLRLKVIGNTDVWDATNDDNADVLAYGATEDSLVDHNLFRGGSSGMELFSADASTSGYYLSQIAALGLRNNLFSNNTCETMGYTCGWVSVADRTTFADNTANGCSDVCLDAEGSSNTLFIGNSVSGGVNGDITTFYNSIDNVISSNTILSKGEAGITIRNATNNPVAVQRERIVGNKYSCTNSSNAEQICTFAYMESNQDTTIESNKIIDGSFSYVQYSARLSMLNNTVVRDVASSYPGLLLPDMLNQQWSIAQGNTLQATAAQSGPCLAAGSSDSNQVETYYFLNNSCLGWTTDGAVTNSGTNNAIANVGVFRNNTFSTGTITSSTGAPVTVVRSNNFVTTGSTSN